MRFPRGEVLAAPHERDKRTLDLRNAHELGDLLHYKVVIHFLDDAGVKKVETTIWDLKAGLVCLKYGIKIPANRVLKVVFP